MYNNTICLKNIKTSGNITNLNNKLTIITRQKNISSWQEINDPIVEFIDVNT